MIRRSLAVAVGAILVLAPLASGRASETIDVGDNFFAPKKETIKKNDRLKFDWVGAEEHTVTKGKGPGPFFDSGPITGSGIQFKRKFTKKGNYTLICTLHSEMTMKVEVK
jgi:plastocyanin